MSCLTFALDTMSGDFGPRFVVPAAVRMLKKYPNLCFYLVGERSSVIPFLPDSFKESSRLKFIDSKSVITHDMSFTKALKISEQSSMRLAIELVQSGQADACISSGNTGALMGLSTLLLKPIEGIERPALVAMFPNKVKSKYTVMLDLGANAETTERMLIQFALMGSIFAQQMLHIEAPKLALLNIGKEAIKGKDQIKQVSKKLAEQPLLNFTGYVEGNEILSGIADVIVCDGFTGNIALKSIEGTAHFLMDKIKTQMFPNSFLSRWLNPFLQKRIRKVFGDLDPSGYNGATLLGLQGIVIKSHGAANSNAFCSAIEQAIKMKEHDIPTQIEMNLPATF